MMIEEWLDEVKKGTDPEQLGMILVHNGIVRGTSKQGKEVKGMRLSFDEAKLAAVVEAQKKKEGISTVRVWINGGELKVGDDLMLLLVAGRFRTDVLPVFEETLTIIKKEIVNEEEMG